MTVLHARIDDRYQLERLIGSEETYDVIRARDVVDDADVVVHLLSSGLTSHGGFDDSFERRLAEAAALTHPGIVAILGYGRFNDQAYIASEDVLGGTLRTALERQKLKNEPMLALTAARLVQQVAQALSFAHGRGVVHGGLSPEALLLSVPDPSDPACQVKISHFGLAGVLSDLLSGDELIGLPAYLAPERCSHQPWGTAGDVYALGTMLYELSTGYPPFEARNFREAATSHLYGTPPAPSEVWPDLPPELEPIIQRAMARSATARPSAEQLAQDLGAFMNRYRQRQPQLTVIGTGPRVPAPQPAPLPPAAEPRLRVLNAAGDTLQVQELDDTGLTVGRLERNAIVLDDPTVSRYHLRIDRQDHGISVMDLGSSNGSVLQNRPLLPMMAQLWEWGALLSVGPFWLQLERPVIVPPSRQRLLLLSDVQQLTLTPGIPGVLSLTLGNSGETVDHLTPELAGFGPLLNAPPGATVHLMPGQHGLSSLIVTAPRSAATLAGDYTGTVRVRSREDPQEYAELPLVVTVLPFRQGTLTLQRDVTSAAATHRVVVRNEGNTALHTELRALDEQGLLHFEFGRTELLVPPGAQAEVPLIVEAPVRWLGPTEISTFQVWGESDVDPPLPPVHAQWTRRARLPAWLPGLLLLLGLLLFGLLLAWLMRPPTIDSLILTPPDPQVGEPVTIRWQVHKASRVELRPYASGMNVRDGQYTFAKGFTAPPTLSLVASNWFGSTTLPVQIPLVAQRPVIEQFKVSRSSVVSGNPVRLTWAVQHADTITLDPFGTVPARGSRDDVPPTGRIYRLSAANGSQPPVTQNIEVKVTGLPLVVATFTAFPSSVTLGPGAPSKIRLNWATAHSNSVTISPNIGPVGASMNLDIPVPAVTTQYVLLARNAAGEQKSLTTTVTVKPAVAAPDRAVVPLPGGTVPVPATNLPPAITPPTQGPAVVVPPTPLPVTPLPAVDPPTSRPTTPPTPAPGPGSTPGVNPASPETPTVPPGEDSTANGTTPAEAQPTGAGPAIAALSVSPKQVRPGQRVAINWSAPEADRVTLEPFGAVALEGALEDAPIANRFYRLTAWKGEQKTVQSFRVLVDGPLNLEGFWYLTGGHLHLNVNNGQVTGAYDNLLTGDQGTLSGTTDDGLQVTGTATSLAGTRPFKLLLDAKRTTIQGTIGDWASCGARPDQAFAQGCGPTGAWSSQLAGIGSCPVTLTQINEQVQGNYCRGTLSGTVQYGLAGTSTTVEGSYNNQGTGRFRMGFRSSTPDFFQGDQNLGSAEWCGWRGDSPPEGICSDLSKPKGTAAE